MANLHELWGDLRASTAGNAIGFSLRLFSAHHDLRVYAALKNPGTLPGIVIEMPTSVRPRDLSRITTRTFEAAVEEYQGLPSGHCAVSIVLHESEYEDLFEQLGAEIALAVQDAVSNEDAARAVVRRIDRWRRFTERRRRGLTDEDVRGLIGELVVLSRCLGKFGAATAVEGWQGMGGLRDFELPEFSTEVKTYQAETGAAVRINDPQQLEGSASRPVYLAVIRLARSEAIGRTLADTAEFVDQALRPDPSYLEDFRDRLADRGYIAAESERYTERFSVGRMQMFEVRDTFPRIETTTVPQGVVDVDFSILLAAIPDFAVNAASLIGAATALETS